MKNGIYRKVPKDLVSRSGGIAFQNLDLEVKVLVTPLRDGKRSEVMGYLLKRA